METSYLNFKNVLRSANARIVAAAQLQQSLPSTDSSYGTAQPNAIMPANTSLPIDASQQMKK
ncbi:hypothetical protein LSUB1_G007476 [Lachnellula subtilissima]|uniref:Uncharacterized protein n=1 Tax=Lachnellula subtilissima TaxID=602034 RepID=A0A8H8U771_9HELO|nr:hypothetical protein LSUB1_G007476 [Lachnellula subtilissima]